MTYHLPGDPLKTYNLVCCRLDHGGWSLHPPPYPDEDHERTLLSGETDEPNQVDYDDAFKVYSERATSEHILRSLLPDENK